MELRAAVSIGKDAVEDVEDLANLNVKAGLFEGFTGGAVAEFLAKFKDAAGNGPFTPKRLGGASNQQGPTVMDNDGSDADDGVVGIGALHGLLVEEVDWAQVGDFPCGSDALELKTHLAGAAAFGGEDVGWIRVHFNVGSGGASILIFSDLQQLIAKFDAVVQAKKSHHLVAKAGVVLHIIGIEDSKDAVNVMAFEATLKVCQNVAHDFV